MDIFKNLKSDYALIKIFDILPKRKLYEIIKYNNRTKKRLNMNLIDYKEFRDRYLKIEIEIIPAFTKKYFEFINYDKKYEKYYHIYFNEGKEEIKRNYLVKKDKVKKIKILIDYKIKSLENLFINFLCIESIHFKKFPKQNIINMRRMFHGCSSLKEIKFSDFDTSNITNMSGMFYGCASLEEINLAKFNTINVNDMSEMFFGCSSLKKINLSNFNTNNVNNMKGMFRGCSSLTEINVINFNIKNVTDMRGMFFECTEEIKAKIREQIKDIKDEAFEN